MHSNADSLTESQPATAGSLAFPSNKSGEINRPQSIPSPTKPLDPFDEFDPAKLRLDQSTLGQVAAKKLRTTIPNRKPGKQDFFRVHPDEAYRLTPAAIIELKEDREHYLVHPDYVSELSEAEYSACCIYLCINRQGVVSLWPVKLPAADGRQNPWHLSAIDAAEKAMGSWIKMTANMNLGAYDIFQAEAELSNPDWPTESFRELLSIAFKGRMITNAEHPVIQKLRGLI